MEKTNEIFTSFGQLGYLQVICVFVLLHVPCSATCSLAEPNCSVD